MLDFVPVIPGIVDVYAALPLLDECRHFAQTIVVVLLQPLKKSDGLHSHIVRRNRVQIRLVVAVIRAEPADCVAIRIVVELTSQEGERRCFLVAHLSAPFRSCHRQFKDDLLKRLGVLAPWAKWMVNTMARATVQMRMRFSSR